MSTNTEFVIYNGRIAAIVTATRFQLCGDLQRRPADDPERNFVQWMCFYAGEALCGTVTVPYTQADARQFARERLIPNELRDHPLPNPRQTSRAFGVPVSELLDRDTWFQPGAVGLALLSDKPGPTDDARRGSDLTSTPRRRGLFRFRA